MFVYGLTVITLITVTAATARHIIVSQMYLLLLLLSLLLRLLLLVFLSTMDNRTNIAYNVSLCSRGRCSLEMHSHNDIYNIICIIYKHIIK